MDILKKAVLVLLVGSFSFSCGKNFTGEVVLEGKDPIPLNDLHGNRVLIYDGDAIVKMKWGPRRKHYFVLQQTQGKLLFRQPKKLPEDMKGHFHYKGEHIGQPVDIRGKIGTNDLGQTQKTDFEECFTGGLCCPDGSQDCRKSQFQYRYNCRGRRLVHKIFGLQRNRIELSFFAESDSSSKPLGHFIYEGSTHKKLIDSKPVGECVLGER